ncbi:MAG: Asp-tRNA(Asn)/Glu-tRNA(Gln) amidotransferase subunit GatA [bacterium]|nr:Asp-tRNA(Asn)/Glu-tRNA(Gln) amidotransferase subunit GatA [bacterium]
MKLYTLTCHQAIELIKKGEIKAEELVLSVISMIEEKDGKINAYITRTFDSALEEAKRIDGLSEKPSLAGIPIAIKDNICTKGILTTCGSKILTGFIPPYDATVISKLKDAGAIIIGKTNMDEFAMGSSCETSAFGPTRNPHNLDYVPGGTSGGSAAAVAANETILSLGSDTGGSIRQPASFCGIVGLKPTYGRVSRYGLIAHASSFDQIGPLTKDVTDAALLMKIISGYDPADSTSIKIDVPDYLKFLEEDLKDIKIGIPKEYFAKGINPEVKSVVLQAVDLISKIGAQCEDVSMPHTEYAIPCYYILVASEASSNLARYDGVQYGYRAEVRSQKSEVRLLDMYRKTRSEGFGDEVKRRIMLGTYALSAGYYDAYYLKAQKVRTLIKQDFDKAFEKYDALITPVSPFPAFKIGEKMDDPLQMYLADIYTVTINLTGVPAISISCGLSKEGIPIGLQIICKPFDEQMLFKIAFTLEKYLDRVKKELYNNKALTLEREI